MIIPQEIPIKSFSIAAYVCRTDEDYPKFLIIKRRSKYLGGTWQMISGLQEEGEKGWEAAIREIKEETGLTPDRFYSTNEIDTFYEVKQNIINLVPIFAGFLDKQQEVVLSPEHSEYKWVTTQEAIDLLYFKKQADYMKMIEDKFIKQEPLDFLRIRF
jgi:dihydroneopterin triphosphate diphosphatase